jgi:hypothetical protein
VLRPFEVLEKRTHFLENRLALAGHRILQGSLSAIAPPFSLRPPPNDTALCGADSAPLARRKEFLFPNRIYRTAESAMAGIRVIRNNERLPVWKKMGE